jgi:hypothetical protein
MAGPGGTSELIASSRRFENVVEAALPAPILTSVATGLYASVDDVKGAMAEMGYPIEDAERAETVPATRPAK